MLAFVYVVLFNVDFFLQYVFSRPVLLKNDTAKIAGQTSSINVWHPMIASDSESISVFYKPLKMYKLDNVKASQIEKLLKKRS